MILLQERDRLILNYLKRVGWSLSSYIGYHFFKDNLKATTNRLLKLEKANLIEAENLRVFQPYIVKKETANVLFSNVHHNTKIYKLHDSVIDLISSDINYNTDKRLIIHQLMVSFVLKHMNSELSPSYFYTEEDKKKFYKMNDFYSSYKDSEPDLVIYFGSKSLAIEIERKARRGLGKYNNEYNDRIDKLSSEFDYILYVMENLQDLKKMIQESEGLNRVGFCSIYEMNRILRRGHEQINLKEFIGD